MQNISVLDLLKRGKIYRADYNRIFDKDYLKQYKFLAYLAGFEDCPIFCATEKSKHIISSSGLHKSKTNILLTLNVPDDETYCTEYYTWTDYLYFSTEKTNFEYVKELEDELKQNLVPENCSDPQIIIDRIEPSWVEGLTVDDHKNDDLEDISVDETNQTDNLLKLKDSEVIDEDLDDNQILNEASSDNLRMSNDLSDSYIKKYFNNYHKELVFLDDILKDTDNLHNNAMKTRRTEVWGQDPDLYEYDINKGYYASLQEPIRVAKINGKFIILDGNHRLRALANNGYKQVEVLVRNI